VYICSPSLGCFYVDALSHTRWHRP
jgi:hypothetical protein